MRLDELSAEMGLRLPGDAPSPDLDELAFWAEAAREGLVEAFDPSQQRAPDGKWSKGGGLLGSGLAASIKQFADLSRGNPGRKKDDKPRGAYEYVADYGRAWEPAPLSPKMELLRGEQGQCFKNAADVVLGMGGHLKEPGLRYVEGYALPEGIPLPIHHAWAVDNEGRVLELTWPEAGTEYIGAEFDDDTLRAALLRSGTYGLLDGRSIGDLPKPRPKVRGTITPGFAHKDTPDTFWDRMEDLGHERPDHLREARTLAQKIEFNPLAHPKNALGQFRETLDKLKKPRIGGDHGEGVNVLGTPHEVKRTRKGFEVTHESPDVPDKTFNTSAEAADFVEGQRREATMKAETDKLLTMEKTERAALSARQAKFRAEQEKIRAEKDKALRERDAALKKKRADELERKYPKDSEGRHYYHRIESPTQTPEDAAKQEASGELWGRESTNSHAGLRPTVQTYRGRLPLGTRGLEFVTGHPPDDGTPPDRGNWRIQDEPSDQIRLEDGFAKLKINVTKNTQTING